MNGKIPKLEQHRSKWKAALKKQHHALRTSPALRNSEAPVSLLLFNLFALQTTVTALPDANATGKVVKVGTNLVIGAAKLALTSDPRALYQAGSQLASEVYEKVKRLQAEFYAQQLLAFFLRPLQADMLTVAEVGVPTVPNLL